jgi:hypothetical protein
VSWRVLVLIPTDADLGRYDLRRAWNDPHNKPFILAPCGQSYLCPSESDSDSAGRTSYLAVVGKGTVWSDVRLGHIHSPDKDVPNKIVVIEVPRSGVYWTEPRDLSADEAIELFRMEDGFKDRRHRRGLHYLTADGKVHSFDQLRSVEEFAALIRAR